MRLGKRLKKSSFWKKAGAGHQNKPKHVSRDSVVGRVDPDLISSVYTPLFLDLAGETLERYADDLMQYEDLLVAHEKQQQQLQQQKEEEVEKDTNETEQAQGHGQGQGQAQAHVEVDGTIHSTTKTTTTTTTVTSNLLPPVEPTPPLFRSQYRIDEFSQLLADTSDHFFAKTGGWRVHANAAKFERMLDEKYGIFRPFITNHPEIEQFVRQMQRKYAMGDFSPIRSKPPIPRSTSIILLFLMQRGKIQWEVLTLAFLFLLVGLQPWALVACVAVGHAMVMRRKARPVGRRMRECTRQSVQAYYHRSHVTVDDVAYDTTAGLNETAPDATLKQEQELKYKLLNKPVGVPLKENETLDTSNYDTIILGSGAPCLFAAALLSRAGRRVLVLCPDNADASECVVLEHPVDHRFRNVPFDVGASNMSKISRQQKLLAPALCTDRDCQGGIRFAKIGSKADGHAFELLSVPGVGTDRADQQTPFVLKADGGVNALMEDAAAYLGDGWPGMDGSVGHSNTGTYVKACEQMNASAGEYYLGKVLPESTAKYRSTTMYQTAASKYAESIINQYFPLNAHARSLMAAVGVKNESLRPSKASMAVHITNVCAAMSGEGMHYPVGGPRALCHALATVVEQLGGRIVTNAAISELLFSEESGVSEAHSSAATSGTDNNNTQKESTTLPPPTCVGVKLTTGAEVRFAAKRFKDTADLEKPAIVSMLPFITTFIRVFPSSIRTKYGCPRGLGALAEQRPVFKFIFALDGNASDLSLTGADYYRVPSAALAVDEMDPTTNQVKHGEIGWADADEKTVSASDTSDSTRAIDSQSVDEEKRRTSHQKRFERSLSWIHVSFPSAKDPSFPARYGNISTCVVTIEADDDFAIDMGSKPRIFQTKKTSAGVVEELKHLEERVYSDLIDIFPQLQGKIKQVQVVGPRSRGMNHTPERFVVKGVHALSPYKRLFYGGPDLTIGESFSAAMVAAWLVSNAVAGYTVVDHLFLQKNISADLGQFIEDPGVNEDDVAVPYHTKPDKT